MNLKQAAWFSAVPWSMMAFTGYIAGFWSDLLIRRGTSITLTRKIMQVCDSQDRIELNHEVFWTGRVMYAYQTSVEVSCI